MTSLSRKCVKSTPNEQAFCKALLNNENPIFDDTSNFKKHKRGFYLPPDNYVYGIKHPKQHGITGVAAALQHCCTPMKKTLKAINAPNFITINKNIVRLGLTKVQDIQQYRKTMKNRQMSANPCPSILSQKKIISNMTHGRKTGKRQSIRDLIENKYLHEWLHKAAVRRCKEILNYTTDVSNKKSDSHLLNSSFKRQRQNHLY